MMNPATLLKQNANKRSHAIWTLLLLLLFGFSLSAHAVFTTPGQFSVSPSGAATYSIPIQVPPGTAGMAPKLSLNYNSQGGNGILGLGWGLEGLSQISRCPRTIVQDGVMGGVNYDANDKYCIDGQRLIASAGTYGSDGTQYRTELANFAKIISYGTAGNGPAWFKVWTKGGQIIEYGNTADSRIEAAGITTVRTWGVNRISDTKGNYITVTYIEDNANGEAYISQIDYTGNTTTGLTPYASVQFTYATRSDTTTDYLAGSVIKVQHRITDIKTYNGATLVKDYKLTYANTGAWHVNTSNVADGSLLTQIQECDGNTTPTCQNPTNLTWTPGTVNTATFGAVQTWVSLTTGSSIAAVGDINGDGKADITWVDSTTGQRVFALSTGTGFSAPALIENVPGVQVCTHYTTILGKQVCDTWATTYPSVNTMLSDLNGDGLADLIYANGTVRLSSGSGFGALQTWVSLTTGSSIAAVGDINGDGKADITWVDAATGQRVFALSTGTGFSAPALIENVTGVQVCVHYQPVIGGQICDTWATTYPSVNTMLSDLNGDGLADLVYANGGVRLSLTGSPDLLTTVTGGFGEGATISYKPLSDSSAYTYESGSVYPIRDILQAVQMYVVSSASSNDGIGGTITSNYTYGGAKVDVQGRGFLGFRWMKSSSPDSGLTSTTFNRQDYPYIGLPAQSEKRTLSGNVLLSAQANTYANTPLVSGSATSQFPYVTQTLENNYELDGSLVTSTTTAYQYDAYGNVTQVSVTSNDGFVKTTTNTYNNDEANWLLGRLLRSSVSSTALDPVPYVPPAALSVSISPTPLVVNATTSGNATGSATLTGAGGIPPYTYSWTRLSGNRISVNGTQTAIFSVDLGTGENLTESYQATITDAVGNIAIATLNITFTSPAAYTFNATIAANTTNYNLKSAAIAAGWDQVVPLIATVTINSGVIVGSTSTGAYAFDTGATFTAGSTLTLINNGKILGAGGAGGKGSTNNFINNNTPGSPGGPAVRVQNAISITNNGVIGGGGGGGAGQPMPNGSIGNTYKGNGGGGGQGFNGGTGGAAGSSGSISAPASAGTAGTTTSPGSPGGGALGASGAATTVAGGAAGACTSGNANITWTVPGSRFGALN